MNGKQQDLHERSITDQDAFWLEEAARIDWDDAPVLACEYSNPPFARWFPDGRLNLCKNAVDRWARLDGSAAALIAISSETGKEEVIDYATLLHRVQHWAGILADLGVGKGNRVLIYMPMIAEAVYAMLATVRLGAIHSVVFGGFAAGALASRIDDATPKVVVSADAGMRGGKTIPYRPLLEDALRQARHAPEHVLMVDRGLASWNSGPRDVRYAPSDTPRDVPCVPVEAAHPSYILYTSGTTGRPKGVQRDTGGHAVALASAMAHVFGASRDKAFFATSDIGWVVGHSFIVYGPLLVGVPTILYEGLPTQPDTNVWWDIVARHRVGVMFTAPTALRLLRREGTDPEGSGALETLEALFVAGEPLDAPTATWASKLLGVPVLDNYWQTETGWPILATSRGIEPSVEPRIGRAGRPVHGFDVQLGREGAGRGILTIRAPLPPGCLSTVWGDDDRFVQTYFKKYDDGWRFSTSDIAERDEDGWYEILGREDDVLNVAGHRLGTGEIEEALIGIDGVAEAAVIGRPDDLKGEVPVAFIVAPALSESDPRVAAAAAVDASIGAIARPADVIVVPALPKTRSGKILRRTLREVYEGRRPTPVPTIEAPEVVDALVSLMRSRISGD